jgi:hypothetical protein
MGLTRKLFAVISASALAIVLTRRHSRIGNRHGKLIDQSCYDHDKTATGSDARWAARCRRLRRHGKEVSQALLTSDAQVTPSRAARGG